MLWANASAASLGSPAWAAAVATSSIVSARGTARGVQRWFQLARASRAHAAATEPGTNSTCVSKSETAWRSSDTACWPNKRVRAS